MGDKDKSAIVKHNCEIINSRTSGEITKLVPMIFHIVWDIKNQKWYRPYKKHHPILPRGVWISEDNLPNDPAYDIVSIDLSKKIPPDFYRIYNLEGGFDKRSMIEAKLRQLIEVFIFMNNDLKKQMTEKWR